ncbi:MAG TPA: hypothetical protein VLX90_12025 [Steroidobacteraceae bacterium]|nr:hypothetical protein [Steroidobacteraceae bacterium]
MNRPSTLAFLAALFLTSVVQASEPWPEIPSPPKARVEWVGDNMRVNGVPTRIMEFQSKSSRDEIVEYYRAYWTGAYPKNPSIKPLGEATVISQWHGPYLMTVKVEDAGDATSQGLIAVSRVAGSKASLDAGSLPLMPGARVISVIESDDPGKHSREVVVLNPQPPQSVLQFYQTSYENGGWQPIENNTVSRTAKVPGGSFLVFAHERTEMQLSTAAGRDGRGSVLVANEVTKDTGPQRY